MPITYSEVLSVGDILDSSRHTLMFPNTPAGGDGRSLTLRHGAITLPRFEVAQIISKPFGWSVAHAGRRMQENIMSVEFFETTGGPSTKTLVAWQNLCHGLDGTNMGLKRNYAVNCEMSLYDTTGKTALKFKCINVWPKTIDISDYPEESTPAHVRCEFSIDALDLVGFSSNNSYMEVNPVSYPNNSTMSNILQENSKIDYTNPIPSQLRNLSLNDAVNAMLRG
jgi:hypothetical protein